MMISPEEYYESELKGRNRRELLSRILNLKQQMNYLKNCMENPYHRRELVHPDEATQLAMTREYLAAAKKAYAEAGGEYQEGMSGYLAAMFLEKLPELKKITFYIGGYFGGRSVYEIEISDGGFHLTGMHYPEEQPLPVDSREIILDDGTEIKTAEDLFDYFRSMHMEEWLPDYDPERFGYTVLDGTQWELTFEYGNGHNPWESGGSNSYPWNFADLCRLFGEPDPQAVIEENEEQDETDEPEYKEYLYCLVTPEDMNRSFHYISEIPDIAPGETVVIPYGADNNELFGTVVSVEVCDEWTAPFPVEKTKKILRRATDEELRRLRERDLEKYTYCWVVPEGNDKGCYYISELEDIRKGDMVMISFGYDNREVFGKVLSVRRTSAKNAPYPPENTKRILRKLEPDQNIYEFLTVLPITHKRKTFGYINTIPDVSVGDYVEVQFKDGGKRIAQVRDRQLCSIDLAPDNFMGSLKVLRKLNYENCDYIRFQAELLPLAMKGELFRSGRIPDSLAGVLREDRLKPCLTGKAVEAFEKVYQVHLPEEYRAFVTEVSNGYGEKVLGLNVIDYVEEYTWMKERFRFGELVKMALESGNEMPELEYECECDNCEDCEKKEICPHSECLEIYGNTEYLFLDGTLETYTAGDGTERMIVNGEYAGSVFRMDDYSGRRYLVANSFLEYIQGFSKPVQKSLMKVRYIGTDMVAMKQGKVYDVIAIEQGWYRIMTEIEEDYLFAPVDFELVVPEEKVEQ